VVAFCRYSPARTKGSESQPKLKRIAFNGIQAPGRTMALTVTPIDFAEANAFVSIHHRHHKPVVGVKFCVAVSDQEGKVRGVAMVGRPIARLLDNGWTLEVNRCCTDGERNACSMLYGAAWRVAKELGYRRLITYTLPQEGGASLRGAGWRLLGERGGGNWNTPSRPRVDTAALLQGQKLLWEAA